MRISDWSSDVCSSDLIDRPGLQAIVELDLGRLEIRLGPAAGFKLHQRIGLLDARRKQAAGTVILEAAPGDAHAVCQKRRGQRISRELRLLHPVKSKSKRPGSIDKIGQAHVRIQSTNEHLECRLL